ncbi:acyl-CoA synthetase (AMP-forming)/AMP-acid ligase II [Desulfoscipio gibsoniae DSM 7213]|uniref:Acyl-CoA synthetase (AMP-forming)/AMP-acid ligase II n=1 Tax=Desulfoscipio gibsoniae DSM 7213 TaxID=767817 RepID=R4KJ99_9FIRM|nr:acyl-CoA synthetase (AMP-forming)/AMP-acid ligase II [Desulfoscipio gibsoniae DSM 7213]
MLLNLGLEKGDRVAFLDKTCPWYLEFYYGITLGGLVAVPLNYRLVERELIYIINNCRPKAIIVGSEYTNIIDSIRSHIPTIKHFISMEPADGYMLYESKIKESSPLEPNVEISAKDLAVISYTSGTTSMPKGVMLSHGNISANAANENLSVCITHDDIVYYPAPLFHVMGCMAMGMLATGCTLVFEEYKAEKFYERIQQESITKVVTTAGPLTMLVNSEINYKQYDLSSLRTVITGGSPMPGKIATELFNILPNLEVMYVSFAQTEASPFITIDAVTRQDILEGRYNEHSGREVFLTRVKIVDDQDNDLPVGHRGEIIARGPNVMLGYWEMPEENTQTLREGWLHTNDIGYFDSNGYLYVVDRKKDMILSGSENVSSKEVESVLYQHPAIADAAVIGVSDEKWGERVHAVIVLKSGQQEDPEGIIKFCRENLAGYKTPRSIEFISDLPRNATGKVLKNRLREKYKK